MIEFPGMRRELIGAIGYLCDKEMQRTKWADSNYPHAFWNNLDFSLDTLLDCTDYLDNSENPIAVGVTLRDTNEADFVRDVAQKLKKVIKKIGVAQPDSAYLNSPLWDDVVEAAKHAYEVLMNDEDLDALLEAEEKRIVE
jgi:hypothetical protein